MQIIHNSEAVLFQNSDQCVATEYKLNDRDINVAIIKLNGRYPETGRVFQEASKEVCLILEGEGHVYIEDKECMVQKGDMVFIEPGEKYYWNAHVVMTISCTPAWSKDQQKSVD